MEAVNGMKVFQTSDEEYYVAPTIEEAIAAVMKMHDCETEQKARDEGYIGEGYPVELSDESMSKYTIVMEDEDENPTDESCTFLQYLTEDTPKEAGYFCGSNW